jgi:hypothetical protein
MRSASGSRRLDVSLAACLAVELREPLAEDPKSLTLLGLKHGKSAAGFDETCGSALAGPVEAQHHRGGGDLQTFGY